MNDDDGKNTPLAKTKFGHGRTKNVVVETKRKRVVVPKPGASKQTSNKNPIGGDPSKRPAGISDVELERRMKALAAAKAREAEENVLKVVRSQRKRLTNYSKSKLDKSLLRAALTDLRFDEDIKMVVAVPFNDLGRFSDALESDRNDLIQAISSQVGDIIEGCNSTSMNINDEKLKEKLESYRTECEKVRPNPRILYRQGSIIREQLLDPDVRNALNSWDMATLDGFVDDHSELMRNHFSNSLLRAQEIDNASIDESQIDDAAQEIIDASDLIESMSTAEGREIIDKSIPAILRDTAKDIRDYRDAASHPLLQENQAKRLRSRYLEAVKNGAVFLGRISFFFTVILVSTSSAATFSAVGSLASILGVIEIAKPGTIYGIYSRFRKALPILPELPGLKND